MATVSSINGIAFTSLSALDGRTLSTLTSVNGQTIDAAPPNNVNIGNNSGNSGGVLDNRLDNGDPDGNYGGDGNAYFGNLSGGSRIFKEVQRFDLSSIPAGRTCITATLYLYDTNWGNHLQPTTLDIYEIAAANSTWVAGTANAAPQVGSCCWNKKTYNTVAWAGSAGLSTATTDYINTSLGTLPFPDHSGFTGYRAVPINSSGLTVLAALFGGTGGAGWVLVGSGAGDTAVQFEGHLGTDGHRPYLAIGYSN